VTTAASDSPRAVARDRSIVDVLVAAFPVVALALAVLVFYAVEAWTRHTPWIFGDELEWTQISRAIATTGHAARRTQPTYFKSVYAYVIAPFWWIHSTATAYAAIKYANAVLMPLAAVPTYLLARMLVTRRSAIAVALLSVTIPGMSYVTSIIPEVVFYPYYALCSWLVVRAYRSGKRLDVILAGAFVLGGYLIKESESTTLPAAFAIGAAGLWLTGPRGKAMRRNWTRGDTLGAVLLVAGLLFFANRLFLQNIAEWQSTTQHDKELMIDLGLRAALSLTIGLGVLPVVGGLVSLHLPERKGDATYRAFVAWTGSTILSISVYTAVKAAYLSDNFGTFWEERNMIYLSPLLLLGTALVFESRRVDRRLLAGAVAFVAAIIGLKAIQTGYPYFEAPGSAIPAILTVYRHWSTHSERVGLFAILALSVAALLTRRRRAVAATVLVFVLAWTVSGEIAMTVGIDKQANLYLKNLLPPAVPGQPTPSLDWVDRATGGRPTTYIGQELISPFGLWLTEFWNRSIDHVDAIDTTAPGPGPHGRPGLQETNGLLTDYSGDPYVLADFGLRFDDPVVAQQGAMTLYRQVGPWHLLSAVEAVYEDGWCPSKCNFTYYKPRQHGTLVVTLSRTGYGGSSPPAKVKLVVGAVRIDNSQEPALGTVWTVKRVTVPNGTQTTVRIPVAQTPVRLEVSIRNVIPLSIDPRGLGAQISFAFDPATRG
jgi:hypothetical protein